MHLSSTAQYDEAEGISTKLSFDEALAHALDALPPRTAAGGADEQTHVDVISTRVDVGGIAPRILVVRVRRAKTPQTFLCRDWEAWHDRIRAVRPRCMCMACASCLAPATQPGSSAKCPRASIRVTCCWI